jgi:hypothetical protein
MYLSLNKINIQNDEEFVISIHIKNISGEMQELWVGYFVYPSRRLNVYYKTEAEGEITIPFSMYIIVDTVMRKETVFIEPLEEVVFKIYGVYKRGPIYDMGARNRYNGYALVFEQDGTFFKIPDNVDEVKFDFKIIDTDLIMKTDEVFLTFRRDEPAG